MSDRYPYLGITLGVGERVEHVVALLDTGFDGDVVVPVGFAFDRAPDAYVDLRQGNGTVVRPPSWEGVLRLGSFDPFPVRSAALGSEFVVGRDVAARYGIFLDHGHRVVVEA